VVDIASGQDKPGSGDSSNEPADANTEGKKVMSELEVEVREVQKTAKKSGLTQDEILLKTLQAMVKVGNKGLYARRQVKDGV
jgi:hypothetical protein